jgi:hypothetical protein
MPDIIIDLETLSTKFNAAILVIAGIKFNRNNTLLEGKEENYFYKRITLESCIEIGLHVDPETQKWWSEQDKDVQYEALHNPDRVHIKQALKEFSAWFGTGSICIWGNGPSFDCGILKFAYEKCGLETPWSFWLERDIRTIFDLAGVRIKDLPQDNKHHALSDCRRELVGFRKAIKILKLV